eukprot:498270_1
MSRRTRSQTKQLKQDGLYDSNDEKYIPLDKLKWPKKKKHNISKELEQKMQAVRDSKSDICDERESNKSVRYSHLWNADTQPNSFAHNTPQPFVPPHIDLIPDKQTTNTKPRTRSQTKISQNIDDVCDNIPISMHSDIENCDMDIDPAVLHNAYKKNTASNKNLFCESLMDKLPNNKLSGKHSLWHFDILSNIFENIHKYNTCDCNKGYKIIENTGSKWNCGLCESYDIVCNNNNCCAPILENIQNSLWMECTDIHNIETGINYKNSNNRPNNKTQRCVPVTNAILQCVGSQHGSLGAVSDEFCDLLGLNRLCWTSKARANHVIAEICIFLGDESASYWRARAIKFVIDNNLKNLPLSLDDAWGNEAHYLSSLAYGFGYTELLNKFISYCVKSLYCHRCATGIIHDVNDCDKDFDRADVSSNKLGWKATEENMLTVVREVKAENEKLPERKQIGVEACFDGDRKAEE